MKSLLKHAHLEGARRHIRQCGHVVINAIGDMYRHLDVRNYKGEKLPEAYEEAAQYHYPPELAKYWKRFDRVEDVPDNLQDMDELFVKAYDERENKKYEFKERNRVFALKEETETIDVEKTTMDSKPSDKVKGKGRPKSDDPLSEQ